MKLATVLLALLVVATAVATLPAASAELMIVGNDEKVGWDDAGKPVFSPPGKDTVSIVDIGGDPMAPRVIANLPLMNSIFGPPVNLAITPDERLAIVPQGQSAQAHRHRRGRQAALGVVHQLARRSRAGGQPR